MNQLPVDQFSGTLAVKGGSLTGFLIPLTGIPYSSFLPLS